MTSPKVTLLASPKNPDAVALVSAAARLCRRPDSIKRLVEEPISVAEQTKLFNAVMEAGHWSCLRHAVFVFGVEGVSRSESHQHVRHGIGHSYEQQSQHFICEKKGTDLRHAELNHLDKVRAYGKSVGDTPEQIEERVQDVLLLYEDAVEVAKGAYDNMVMLGLPHHEARQALPNGAETRFIWTANLEAILNFVTKRACRVNTAEIYEVATQVRDIVKKEVPLLESWLGPTCYTRGVCYEGVKRYQSECGKPWGGQTVLWTPQFPREILVVSAKGYQRIKPQANLTAITTLPYPIKDEEVEG